MSGPRRDKTGMAKGRYAMIALLALALGLGIAGGILSFEGDAPAEANVDQAIAQGLPTPPRLPPPAENPEETNDLTPLAARPAVPQPAVSAPPDAPHAPTIDPERTTNILLLGTDQRPEDTTWRTDSLMVTFLDAQARRAAILSLPRDLFVDIPGHLPDRINTVDFLGESEKGPGGGPALLAQVIQNNFGVRVEHYARVNFAGFEKIINTVGGIDVNVPCPIAEDFIDLSAPRGLRALRLPAGWQHLDGVTALMYVRQRHGNSDVSRARRQQHILSALRVKILQLAIVTKIPDLYGQLQDAVKTDLGPLDILNLASVGASIDTKSIRGLVLDWRYTQNYLTADGREVLLPDKAKIRAAVQNIFDEPLLDESQIPCEDSPGLP